MKLNKYYCIGCSHYFRSKPPEGGRCMACPKCKLSKEVMGVTDNLNNVKFEKGLGDGGKDEKEK